MVPRRALVSSRVHQLLVHSPHSRDPLLAPRPQFNQPRARVHERGVDLLLLLLLLPIPILPRLPRLLFLVLLVAHLDLHLPRLARARRHRHVHVQTVRRRQMPQSLRPLHDARRLRERRLQPQALRRARRVVVDAVQVEVMHRRPRRLRELLWIFRVALAVRVVHLLQEVRRGRDLESRVLRDRADVRAREDALPRADVAVQADDVARARARGEHPRHLLRRALRRAAQVAAADVFFFVRDALVSHRLRGVRGGRRVGRAEAERPARGGGARWCRAVARRRGEADGERRHRPRQRSQHAPTNCESRAGWPGAGGERVISRVH
eukprot:29694-Pelagococcus_subviridis.AAC.1